MLCALALLIAVADPPPPAAVPLGPLAPLAPVAVAPLEPPAPEALARVELLGAPAPFALEAGFVELVPGTGLPALARDVTADEELVVDLVRIGKLGKGRAKATVVLEGGTKRVLAVLAPTLASRKLGGSFASLPVRQRAPLPSGTTRLEIQADAPLAVRLSVQKRATLEPLALVPLAPPAPPVAPPVVDAPPVVPPAPVVTAPVVAPVVVTAPPAAAPVVVTPAPVAPPVAAAPVATARVDREARLSPWPRLLAEVHAGTALVFGGLQTFVPGGGARVLLGPRDLDAAFGVAIDFDGQSSFVDLGETSGDWQVSATRLRAEGYLGVGDLALFEARLGVTVGAGARFAWHTASLAGVQRTLFVVGATARLAPEASFPAGPGRFAIALPIDGTLDASPDVTGFAPVAAGVFLGYRLDL